MNRRLVRACIKDSVNDNRENGVIFDEPRDFDDSPAETIQSIRLKIHVTDDGIADVRRFHAK